MNQHRLFRLLRRARHAHPEHREGGHREWTSLPPTL